VSFFDLAKWLNRLGIRNSFGKLFHGRDISKILLDEAFLGYPTFSKRRAGRFHRVGKNGSIREIEPELKGRDTKSDPADIIRSEKRLYEPLVDRPTWDKVQRKLRGRAKVSHPPKNAELYLAGLVVCGGCGSPMVGRFDRREYHCGTWDKHRIRGALADSPCERNGVKQALLEEYIGKYLEETGRRLEILKSGAGAKDFSCEVRPDGSVQIPGPLWEPVMSLNKQYVDTFGRLLEYVAANDAAGCQELYRDLPEWAEPDIEHVIEVYRRSFDPQKIDQQLADLEAQHDTLTEQALNVRTERAVAKVNQRLADLEDQIKRLEAQRQNLADIALAQWREVEDLSRAVGEAEEAMKSEAGAKALRQKAEALRGILCRIDCEFTLTGKHSSGPGQASSKLVALTFVPIAGDSMRIQADGPADSDGGEGIQANR
jgi:hypothetical protein